MNPQQEPLKQQVPIETTKLHRETKTTAQRRRFQIAPLVARMIRAWYSHIFPAEPIGSADHQGTLAHLAGREEITELPAM
jgi:hypothetical protein